MRLYKIAVYTPLPYGDKIRKALAENGAGHIGNYDFCSFSCIGTGRFRAGEKTNPFIGKKGKIEKIKEEKIEAVCPKNKLKKILAAVKKAHPYEEPAIDVWQLENF